MLKLARALAVVLALAAPACARAEPPMWVIRDADSTITLFGSVHMLPRVDWRPRGLDAAMREADDVWFEIPFDPASEAAANRLILQLGPLPPGQTLTGLLDPKARERLERLAPGLGVPVAYIDRLKPWMADLMLSQAFVQKAGASQAQGVETVLRAQVPAGTEVRAFETAEGQIRMLAEMPVADQAAGLAETLRQIDEEPESFLEIVSYWTKGDVAGLASEALDPIRKASPLYYDVLITRRNADWVRQIKQRLAGSGETLIVVGAGHLVGPDSVPAMLRREGVKVDGP
jgi:hypothetical protein